MVNIMIKIIEQEISFDDDLKKKLEFICDFCNTTSKFINGSIRKIDKTNLSYIEPHRIIINDITFLAFNYSNEIFIENLSNKIKLSELEEYLKTRQYLKHVFLLVDYRHKPTEDDVLMYKFLKYYNLPVTIVATKYDKVNRSLREKQDELIKKTLNPALGDEIINFSSVTKVGKERIYEIIESYFKNDKKDIEK